MLRPRPMARVTLWVLASEAPDAALLLARHGVFAPAAADGDLPDAPGAAYRERYQEAAARLGKLLEHCGAPMPPLPEAALAPSLAQLDEWNAWLQQVWQDCAITSAAELDIAADEKRLAALKETFARLAALDLDLSRLLRPESLLDVRLGQVPEANVARLREALGLAGYLLSVFDRHAGQAFAAMAGPRDAQARAGGARLGGLLTQAGWRELPVPEELQTHPEAARRYLTEQALRLGALRAAYCQAARDDLARHGARLGEARVALALARPLAEAARAGVRGQGRLAAFTGWVPRHALPALRAALARHLQGRCLFTARAPAPGEHVPSLLTHPAWLRPFAPLVKGYGVPRYGELDPVLPFAVTYLLLFGAMFGDLGQGGAILILSVLLRARLGRAMWLGVGAGAASMLFGLLYGSVFGYEGLITPLWGSPMHDPLRMLAVAVAFGVGFIAFTLLANTYNRLAAGQVAKALFDAGGLAGLLCYLGAAGGLASLAGVVDLAAPAWDLAGAGAAALAVFKWRDTRAGPGERLLVAAVETLEAGIGLIANTLSFLRVAAFSLNHVALALAVFTLAAGLAGAGHGLAIVLGNVLIIILEGGIVAIQALRLMYYEGFSRFYSGDGTEFAPLGLVRSEA